MEARVFDQTNRRNFIDRKAKFDGIFPKYEKTVAVRQVGRTDSQNSAEIEQTERFSPEISDPDKMVGSLRHRCDWHVVMNAIYQPNFESILLATKAKDHHLPPHYLFLSPVRFAGKHLGTLIKNFRSATMT